MTMSPSMRNRTALVAALAAALPASAVTLNPDGNGHALIYPYYTVQSTGTDAFNTYLSVVNHTVDAKAIRLRFREGRLGKSVLDMNVYLSPNDVWTGAVIPFSGGARLITADRSCTEPRFAVPVAPGEAPFIDFRNDAFSGANDDGAGTGLDRTREGYVEIIEMAKLTGVSAAAVTHNAAGNPANCAAFSVGTALVEAPTGGLSGTLTLINVATGLDFGVNAEALDGLASKPFLRGASDPYPNFNAAEIDPVSVVDANGATYRSTWAKPVDAVSAVLMRQRAALEYVLDQATASLTDAVVTLPTRHYYTSATAAAAPFTQLGRWSASCVGSQNAGIGETLTVVGYNRDEQHNSLSFCEGLCPPTPPPPSTCAAAGVFTVYNASLGQFMGASTDATLVLGSQTRGIGNGAPGRMNVIASSVFSNGWMSVETSTGNKMTSAAQSTMTRHATGATTTGPHTFTGLPMAGFSVRIFRNGTLRCDAGACQGNYGSAFPFKYRRAISPS
jgi:hypothetical protein